MSQALDNSKAKRPCAREGGVGRLVVLAVDDSKFRALSRPVLKIVARASDWAPCSAVVETFRFTTRRLQRRTTTPVTLCPMANSIVSSLA